MDLTYWPEETAAHDEVEGCLAARPRAKVRAEAGVSGALTRDGLMCRHRIRDGRVSRSATVSVVAARGG